jgi:hypothetical protein
VVLERTWVSMIKAVNMVPSAEPLAPSLTPGTAGGLAFAQYVNRVFGRGSGCLCGNMAQVHRVCDGFLLQCTRV